MLRLEIVTTFVIAHFGLSGSLIDAFGVIVELDWSGQGVPAKDGVRPKYLHSR